jgi:hypothetical protein
MVYTAGTQANTSAGRVGEIGLQYRVGTTGTFTNITGSTYQNLANATVTSGTAGANFQNISFSLPSACQNQAVVQLRWAYREVSGAGNRPQYSIDNVMITTTTNPGVVTASPSQLYGFTATTPSPSTSQSVTVTGSGLTNNVTVTAPTGYEVRTGANPFSSTATLTQSSGSVSTTVDVRLSGATVGTFNGAMTFSSTGAQTPSVDLYGTTTAGPPTIVTTGTLSSFSTPQGTPSAEQSFTVSATNLTANLVITPPTGYQVSLTSGSGFAATVSLTPSTGTVNTTTIFVRMTGATVGSFSGNVAAASTGATTQNVAVTGSVLAVPSVATNAATLRKLYSNTGISSDTLCFRVSGSNLTNDISVTLTGSSFEISTVSTGPFGPGPINLTQTAGSVAETQVFVRMKSTATGSVTGSIGISSTGATTLNRTLNGQVFGAGSAFTVGNIVLFRAGENGGVGGVANACPAFIDEITPTGTAVQTIALPLVPNGLGTNNARFTSSGTSLSEGYLNLSPDGRYMTFTGYDVPVNTPSVATTTASGANNNRIVARVTYDGQINTETRINDGYTNSNIRSAVTVDGNSYWVGGTGTGGGTRYVAHASTGASTQLSSSPTNTRVVNISNSQLYTSSASGANIGINKVGTGLSTTTGNSTSLIASISGNDPYNFIFFDRDATIAGNDLLYVANGSGQTAPNTSLRKFSFDGTNWTLRGTITGEFRAVTGRVVGSTIQLFVTVGSTNPNTLYRIDDNAAYNANISNNGITLIANPTAPQIAALPSGVTFISTSPVGSIYKGVSFTPVNNPTPTVAHLYQSSSTSTLPQGASKAEVMRIQINSTIGNALLTGLTFTTGGTYTTTDVTGFKLVSSVDGTLDAGDVTIGTQATVTSGSTLTFNSLAYNVQTDSTRYLFLCADASGCAVVGKTLNATVNLSDITYADANKIGSSTFTSSNKTVILGTPSNVTDVTAPSGFPKVTLTWTNPDCFTDIVVVASTSPIVGTPTGSPTFNTVYTSAPNLLNGKCVFRGSVTPVNITGLTLGTQYYFKIFTNNGGVYSDGIEVTATPNIVNYYAVTSGNVDGAIWSLTPSGSPVLPATLGGFGNAVNLIIRPGVTVQIVNSGVPCNDLTVMSGGKLWRNSDNSSNMAYFNVFGDITCNGTIGNGATFDAIGFNMEGTEQSIGGIGQINMGRIRKFSNTNAITNLNIDGTVSLLFPGLGSLYNSADNTRFNVLINPTGTLNIVDPASSIAIDGFDGASTGQRGGMIVVNGKLISQGLIYAKNNNTSNTQPTFGTSFIVGATGIADVVNLETDILGGKGNSTGIAVGGKLNISGVLTITSGSITQQGDLVIKSTSAGTARIANSAGTITGTVTQERYIPSSGWHFTGTVVGGQTITDWNDNFQTQGPMPGVRVPNPGSNTSNIFEYDQSYTLNDGLGEMNGWKVPTTSSINQYQGYRLYLAEGIKLDNKGSYNMNPSPINLLSSGSSNYKGWNLVMNPHLSAINLSGISFGANVQQTVVVWNPNTNSFQYSGQLGGLTGVTLNNSITPIASGQAFFVKCTSPSSITIPQSAKASTSGSFFRTATESNSPNALEIRIKNPLSEFDATLVQFVEGAEWAYETSIDASKIENWGLNVSTIVDGEKLAINAMSTTMGETVTLPLAYSTRMPGTHGFQFDGLSLVNGYDKVYLKDLYNGTITEMTNSDTYQFTTDAGTFNDRFEIVFTNTLTNVTDLKTITNVNVYPNPVNTDFVNVSLVDNSEVDIEVVDLFGRVITKSHFNSGQKIKFLKPRQSGQYFVKIVTPKMSTTKSISVE